MRGKYKSQRGRARRFTSSHDPDAYVKSRPTQDGDESEEEQAERKSSGTEESGSESATSGPGSDGEESSEEVPQLHMKSSSSL